MAASPSVSRKGQVGHDGGHPARQGLQRREAEALLAGGGHERQRRGVDGLELRVRQRSPGPWLRRRAPAPPTGRHRPAPGTPGGPRAAPPRGPRAGDRRACAARWRPPPGSRRRQRLARHLRRRSRPSRPRGDGHDLLFRQAPFVEQLVAHGVGDRDHPRRAPRQRPRARQHMPQPLVGGVVAGPVLEREVVHGHHEGHPGADGERAGAGAQTTSQPPAIRSRRGLPEHRGRGVGQATRLANHLELVTAGLELRQKQIEVDGDAARRATGALGAPVDADPHARGASEDGAERGRGPAWGRRRSASRGAGAESQQRPEEQHRAAHHGEHPGAKPVRGSALPSEEADDVGDDARVAARGAVPVAGRRRRRLDELVVAGPAVAGGVR